MQFARVEIRFVDVGDFILASCAWLEVVGNFNHIVVVEIQAGHGEVGLGLGGLFFDAQHLALRVKIHHTVSLGVADVIREHDGAVRVGVGTKRSAKAIAVENVVSQDQRHFVVPHKFFAQDKRLREAIGHFLHSVAERAPQIRTVSQQALKRG